MPMPSDLIRRGARVIPLEAHLLNPEIGRTPKPAHHGLSVLSAAHCIDSRCRRNNTIVSVWQSPTNNQQKFLRGMSNRFVAATSAAMTRTGNEAEDALRRPIKQ